MEVVEGGNRYSDDLGTFKDKKLKVVLTTRYLGVR